MTISTDQLQSLSQDSEVYNGADKIGKVGQIYLDDESGEATWVTVKTGLFGTSETFVPLQGAQVDAGTLHVDYDKDTVKNAPRIEADQQISPREEDELFSYYGLTGSYNGNDAPSGVGTADDAPEGDAPVGDHSASADHADHPGHADLADTGDAGDHPSARATNEPTGDVAGAQAVAGAGNQPVGDRDNRLTAEDEVGHDTSGPTTDEAMTRSEERVEVGTATREAGRARLRKYVTTEQVTQTVPVRHEEVTLEREPITEANQEVAGSGPAISEEEHEVVLHEEVPVVDKDVVAVERVKLGTETVTEEATVSEEVRKENIDLVEPDTASDPDSSARTAEDR